MLCHYFESVHSQGAQESKWTGRFYLRPLGTVPKDPAVPWFCIQPVGSNKLNAMMKTMSIQAGLHIIHTNHSLRSCGSTKLFQENVPEKLIQERTSLYRGIQKVRAHFRKAEDDHFKSTKWHRWVRENICSVQPSASVQSSSSVDLYDPAAIQPHLPILHPPPRPCYPQQQTPCYNGWTFNWCTFTINVVQITDSCFQGVVKDVLVTSSFHYRVSVVLAL